MLKEKNPWIRETDLLSCPLPCLYPYHYYPKHYQPPKRGIQSGQLPKAACGHEEEVLSPDERVGEETNLAFAFPRTAALLAELRPMHELR